MSELTKDEAQALLDALDTLWALGVTVVTADLEVLKSAEQKLADMTKSAELR